MLQVAFIRSNPEQVKERLGIRNFKELELVDEIISLDEETRNLKNKMEDAQKQINSKSSEIPNLIKNNQNDEAIKKYSK